MMPLILAAVGEENVIKKSAANLRLGHTLQTLVLYPA